MPCNRQYGRGMQPGLATHRCQPDRSKPSPIKARNSSARSWTLPSKSWSNTGLTGVLQLMRMKLLNCGHNCRRRKLHYKLTRLPFQYLKLRTGWLS